MRFALTVILAMTCCRAPTPKPGPEVRDVSGLLAPIREAYKVPGIVAAVVSADGLVARGADGIRKRGSPEKITIADRFHIGSCTKAFTATLAGTFVEEGKLSWDARVAEVFKDVPGRHRGWDPVTLEDLLLHRGGAPADLDAGGIWGRLCVHTGSPREQRRTLVEEVLELRPAAGVAYSNAGYAIAGAMMETVAGRPWETLLRERVFEPLGMSSAGFGAPGTAGRVDEPRGHTAQGMPVEVGPGSDNPPSIGPAGTVHCSIEDWAKFVSLHLRLDDGHPRPARASLLRAETVARLHRAAAGSEPPLAMGWAVLDRPWGGGRVLMHTGSNTFWFAVTWIAPRKDFAVLVAVNQGGSPGEEACDQAAAALIGDPLRRKAR